MILKTLFEYLAQKYKLKLVHIPNYIYLSNNNIILDSFGDAVYCDANYGLVSISDPECLPKIEEYLNRKVYGI